MVTKIMPAHRMNINSSLSKNQNNDGFYGRKRKALQEQAKKFYTLV